MVDRARLVAVAQGLEPADLVLAGATIVNVVTGELVAGDVVVAGDRIAATGPAGSHLVTADTQVIDCAGLFVAPGLVDPHVHVESSNLTVTELARAIVPRGVLTLCEDPHEIANVCGIAGIEAFVAEAAGLPLSLLLRVPGRVPAMPPHLETSGHDLDDAAITDLLARPDAVALGGDINPALLLDADASTLARIEGAVALGRTVGGQLPGFTDAVLDACVAAGLEDTHVAESPAEVVEQLRRGLRVLLTPRIDRLPAEEWPELFATIERLGVDTRRLCLCTDDIHPNILAAEGHLDHRVRLAIEAGVAPARAIAMASLNPAELMRIDRDRGSVSPGLLADLVVLDDLASFSVTTVVRHGSVVARDGQLCAEPPPFPQPVAARESIRLPGPVDPLTLVLPVPVALDGASQVDAEVVYFGGPKTRRTVVLSVVDGVVEPDGDVARIAVVERHSGGAGTAVGFVGGLGISGGAFASTVNHDSHNIVVVGDSPADMALAADTIASVGGGYVVVAEGEVVALLALPIAGLLSDRPLVEVASDLVAVEKALVERLGCSVTYRPAYALNFLCLPNIPLVGMTDKGVVDTPTMKLVPVVGVADPE
jgi:adenine deaminase